jgi:hypothetical protein
MSYDRSLSRIPRLSYFGAFHVRASARRTSRYNRVSEATCGYASRSSAAELARIGEAGAPAASIGAPPHRCPDVKEGCHAGDLRPGPPAAKRRDNAGKLGPGRR